MFPRLLPYLAVLVSFLSPVWSDDCRAIAADPLPPGAVARLGDYRLLHGATISSVAFSPDGKVIASGGAWGPLRPKEGGRTTTSDQRICLWDAMTGDLIRELSIPEDVVGCVTFSHDGKNLAAGCGSVVRVWRVRDGIELGRHEGHDEDVCLARFAPDGETIFSGEKGGVVHLWELRGGRSLRRWKPGKGAAPRLVNGEEAESVHDFDLSPDGRTLIWAMTRWVGAPGRDGRKEDRSFLRFCDVTSGETIREVEARHDPGPICFSPDGQYFATAKPGVSLWQTSTARPLRELGLAEVGLNHLAFSPDGRTLAVMAFDFCIHLWDMKAEEFRSEITYPCYNRHATNDKRTVFAFSPDGKTLAIGNGTGLLLWDREANRERRLCPGHRGPIEHVTFTADGRSLATTSRTLTCGWTAANWKEAARVERWRKPARHEFFLAMSPGGQQYVTQRDDKDVKVRETNTNRLLRTLAAGPFLFNTGIFSPNGQRLLLWEYGGRGGHNLASVCYDPGGGGQRRAITFPDCIRPPVFSPDNATVAHFAKDGTIRITDVIRGEELRRIDENLSAHRLPGGFLSMFERQAIFSPKGDQLIVAPTGEFSADAPEHEVRFWDVKTGREVRRIRVPLREGEAGAIMGLALSPDGRLLATGQFGEPVIRLWEVATGTQCRQLAGHRDTVLALAFAPDGRTLVSGSADCTALVWDMGAPDREGEGELTPARLDSLWGDLAADARRADEALRILARDPGRSVPFLEERLQPAPVVPPGRIRKLLGDLDSSTFEVRDKARRELERWADQAEAELRRRLAERPTLEVRRCVEELLKQEENGAPSPETLRALRVVACLELAATPEACRLIESLSRGAPGARLTREAQAARERLRTRGAP